MSAPLCLDVLSPGETFEHWCALPAGHAGDHHCADCGDVWNPADPAEIEEWGIEPHEQWHGTCPECVAMQLHDMHDLSA